MSGEEFRGVMSVASREAKKEHYGKEIAFHENSIKTKQMEIVGHKSDLLHFESLLERVKQEEQDELQAKATLN